MKKITPSINGLYIVSTPIGNMEDITYRAVKILSKVDLIAAEDTRNTKKIIQYYNIDKPIISCHEHNEKQRTIEIIKKLKQNHSIAFVSDAGTPLISDPGYYLVSKCIEEKIPVIPIPGASASITALTVAGMPTDRFFFNGFISRKKNKREKELMQIAQYNSSLIFYESPKRIINLLEDILNIMGDRNCFLAREMTKKFEEYFYGNISEIIKKLSLKKAIKGEFTLVVAGFTEKKNITDDFLEKKIIELKQNNKLSVSDIVKKITQDFQIPRKIVYKKALELKSNT